MSDSEAEADKERAFGTLADPWRPPPKLKSSIKSSCRICLSNIWDPARLGCGHRFCEGCLSNYWMANERPEFVTCPLCRNPAFIVGFVPKEDVNLTRDFRKQFDPNHVELITPEIETKRHFLYYLNILFIVPIIFFMCKYIIRWSVMETTIQYFKF